MITFPSLIPFTQMVKRALGDELAPGVENYLDLFTEDATFDFPFSPGGAGHIEGKAKMAEYLSSIEGGTVFDTMNLGSKYRADDGQTTVLEYHCTGSNAETGQPYFLKATDSDVLLETVAQNENAHCQPAQVGNQ